LRTTGGYRRFTTEMLKDIATSSYRQHWFSMDKLKVTFRQLAMAAYRQTGEYEIPGSASCLTTSSWRVSVRCGANVH
jgi:hypothetical protein